MEQMQLKYDEAAKAKGVYVISACGFDSIPADLGVVHFEKKFEGQVNSLESYLECWVEGEHIGGASIHYATWESAIRSFTQINELAKVRAKLNENPMPKCTPQLENRFVIHFTSQIVYTFHAANIFRSVHKSPYLKSWSVPFLGSDRSVVQRSQRILHEIMEKRPVQFRTYFACK